MANWKTTSCVWLSLAAAACASQSGQNEPEHVSNSFGMVPASRMFTEEERRERSAEERPGALSDDMIATVTETAYTARIEEAKIAYPKVEVDEVEAFAQRMLADYGKMRKDENALTARIGLEPEDGELSTELEADSGKVRFALRDAGSGPVDRTYMEAQIAALEKFSNALERRLVPSALNPEFARWLEFVHGRVEAHLEQAREIAGKFDAASETKGSIPSTGASSGAP